MTRGRRAIAFGALAVALGGLAAGDVASREGALARRLGPPVPVLVARADLEAGELVTPGAVATRLVPARYAPVGALRASEAVAGRRTTGAVPAGAYLVAGLLASDAPAEPAPHARLGRDERIVDVVAAGSPELVVPGARVDVLVARPTASGSGSARVALRDAEVVAAGPAGGEAADGAPRVAASLLVTVREAVALAAAQGAGHELRLLARSAPPTR